MIKTITPKLKHFVLLIIFLVIPLIGISQSSVVTGNNVKKQEQKDKRQQVAQKKAAKNVKIDALRKSKLLQKYPEEANPKVNNTKKEEEEVVNGIPSISQALKGIQQGKQYNLKKILKSADGKVNFTKRQDNPSLRQEYNFKRLVDPKTGLMPDGIREKELDYVLSSKSRTQENNGLLQSRPNISFATPGMQVDPWVNRGPFNVGGRTRALAIDINDENRILAGGVSGGLWESTDQGATWSRITPAQEHPSITDIVQDPRPGFQNIWYYSTGERLGNSASGRNGSGFFQGNGIYISTDNAATFTPSASTINTTPQSFSAADPFDLTFAIDVDPTNGNVYVATFAGIHRSIDGGATFTEVLPSDFDNFSDIHITSTGVLYATLDSGAANAGIFRSTDGAAGTWVNITDPTFPATFGRTVVYTAPSNENVLYVYASGTPTAPIQHDFWKYTYVSGDGTGAGGVWEDRSANLPNFGGPVGDATTQGGYDIYVRVHPTDENIVFLGNINVNRSFDGFATPIQQNNDGWIAGYSPLNNVSLYTNHHPDNHAMEFFPSNPDMVVTGHDGGLSLTTNILATSSAVANEPVAWTSLNNGYLTTQVYALSIGPQDQIMAGFQDNSTWFTSTTNVQADWTDLFSGDGSYNAFNDDGTLRYVSAQNGQAFRITYPDANSTAATAFQNIQPAGAAGFLFVNPFELDPNDDTLMYFAAGTSLWRNDDAPNATQTVGWTQLTNAGSPGGTVSAIGISTIPANIVYYGTTTGSVVRIDNANTGNPTGVNISAGLPAASNVTNIDVDPNNPDNVYVTFSNYSIPSIFFSNDGGTSWTDISGNLEENPDGSGAGPSVRWLDIVGNNDLFLVGTSTGLYSTQVINGATTVWTQVDPTGIGNVVVEQIRSREDGLVVVGTHGNGLYSASFEVSVPPIIIVNAIDDVMANANDPDLIIDVSTVFQSNLVPAQPITVTVENNTNSTLLTATLNGDNLTLSYLLDQSGDATITLRGQDTDGNFLLSSFNVTVTPSPINTYPYIQDFENGGVLPLAYEVNGVFPWIVDSGGTPSPGTGPLVDNTTGTGFYVYTEATGGATGDQGFLLSRALDLSPLTIPVMEFNYHMFGGDIGSIDLEIIDLTNGGTITNVFNVTGAQQTGQADPYINSGIIDLSPFTGSIIQLRFVATRGAGFQSDMAIDDIVVMELPDNDLAIINNSAPLVLTGDNQISVEITNLGAQTQSGFDISYQVAGQALVTEQFTGSIARDETIIYTFNTPASLITLGPIDIDFTVVLPSDADLNDNTDTSDFLVLNGINTFPYIESFETGNGSWFDFQSTNSSFELGIPANTIIDAASDGTQAWVTNLTGNYNADEQSTVVSPLFDFTSFDNPAILMDINYDIETNFDGAILQSSIDNGLTWNNVGLLGDNTNWYNAPNFGSLSFASTSTDSWTGNTNGYTIAIHGLDGLGGLPSVALRIVFGSDGSVQQEGFAFDNVRLEDASDLLQIECLDIIASNDLGSCDANITIPAPIFTNASGVVTFSNDLNGTEDASGLFPLGSTLITWTASDELGVVVTCTMEVIVNDDEAPTIDCVDDIVLNNQTNTNGAIVDYSLPTVEDNCMPISAITQSDDQTFVPGNAALCGNGTNGFIRIFNLESFNINSDYAVASLDFAIERAVSTGGSQIATANIYLYDPSDPLEFSSFTLLETEDVTINDGDLFLLNVPIDAIIPAGSTIAVELFTPNGFDAAGSGADQLVPVGQPSGSQAPSYLRGSCLDNGAENAIIDLSASGFPAAQWIINVNSSTEPVITQTAGLASGSVFPIGVTTNTFTFTDGSGNTSECSFNVTVNASPPSPNLGISPNNDGQNDTWIINNITNFPDANIQIFNRNGEEVFSTTNYQNDWGANRDGNGDLLPVGSYYFNITYTNQGVVSNANGWLYINY